MALPSPPRWTPSPRPAGKRVSAHPVRETAVAHTVRAGSCRDSVCSSARTMHHHPPFAPHLHVRCTHHVRCTTRRLLLICTCDAPPPAGVHRARVHRVRARTDEQTKSSRPPLMSLFIVHYLLFIVHCPLFIVLCWVLVGGGGDVEKKKRRKKPAADNYQLASATPAKRKPKRTSHV